MVNSKPSLDIQLEAKAFQAGENLTGSILIYIPDNFKCSGLLKIEATGEESTKVAKQQIWCSHILLHKVGVTFASGLHVFPFSFHLPATLPSSTSYRKRFSIEYKLTAGVIGCFQKQCSIQILSAPLAEESVPRMVPPSSHSVKAARIFNKGNITIGASVANSHVGRGQDIDLSLACRNESTATIRRVEIRFVEKLEWSDSTASITQLHLPDVNLPGLDKTRLQRRRVNPVDQTTALGLQDELLSGRNRVVLTVPPTTRDTFKGQLIQCSHYLEIRLKCSSLMPVADPVIRIPIQVGTPHVTLQQQSDLEQQQTPSEEEQVVAEQISHEPPTPTSPLSTIDSSPLQIESVSIPVQTSIPLVAAVVISDDLTQDNTSGPDEPVTFLKRSAICEDASNFREEDLEIVRVASVMMASDTVSFAHLYSELAQSFNNYDLILYKLEDMAWRNLLARVTPEEFGHIIQSLRNKSEQGRVAALLAQYIEQFTSEYATVAVRAVSECNRSTVARELLHHCVDVMSRSRYILTN